MTGRDAATGDEVAMTVEATTQESAVRRAGRRGVRVQVVEPILDSVDEMDDVVPQASQASGGYRQPPPVVHHHHHEAGVSGGVAALLSLLIPGAGQMVQGRIGSGIGWLVGTFFGYLLFVLPGLILHIICIVDAANAGPATRR